MNWRNFNFKNHNLDYIFDGKSIGKDLHTINYVSNAIRVDIIISFKIKLSDFFLHLHSNCFRTFILSVYIS